MRKGEAQNVKSLVSQGQSTWGEDKGKADRPEEDAEKDGSALWLLLYGVLRVSVPKPLSTTENYQSWASLGLGQCWEIITGWKPKVGSKVE